MPIDRARNSYDASRDWRAVLAQQGRVTLEADVNEQNAIAEEARRLETIDIIGPVGTPDGGYLVAAAEADVAVGAGTLYVGGLRLTLDTSLVTASQPHWLDMPAWPEPSGNQIIALLAMEQSVIAVEDSSLREVALGGPDSAGRLALLQHVLRLPTSAGSCEAAASALPGIVGAQGMAYDPGTCALTSSATLLVTPVAAPTPGGPCDPPAQGGYLGADNQMIRVGIVDYDGVGSGTLVWGWNNASFLHRANYSQPSIVTFLADPLDPDHSPQQGQAVEVLRCTVDFGDGDRSYPGGGNFIAADSGVVMTLGSGAGQGYASATRQLTLPTTLPVDYQGDAPRPLFVRLWQAVVPFTSGVAAILGDTGLSVVITMPAVAIANPVAPGGFGAPPYWEFAVRPSTPNQVYPERFLTAAQPPAGPRRFLASLGVVGWTGQTFQLVEDCVLPFLPLTSLHDCSCCMLTLNPDSDWLTTLTQAIASKPAGLNICFQPGTFTTAQTIDFTGVAVKISGAGGATIITAPGLEVVLRFTNCSDVNLADMTVRAGSAGYLPQNQQKGLQGAVTAINCNIVSVERALMSCADGDIRSASCLAIYNNAQTTAEQYNDRILNSRFEVGNCQVGILVTNADRLHIAGNVVVTPAISQGVDLKTLAQRPGLALQLRKQLVRGFTIVDTARAPGKAARRTARRLAAAQPHIVNAEERTVAGAPPPTADADEKSTAVATAAAVIAPRLIVPERTGLPTNLGIADLAHVKVALGTKQISFVSNNRLTTTWASILQSGKLTATSTPKQIHAAVRRVANDAVFNPEQAPAAFRSFLTTAAGAHVSTSSQGIVVAGSHANDVRILDNTIDGTVQGIHIGFSDVKATGRHYGHQSAYRVQVRGNTVSVRISQAVAGARHGIFLGCATSAMISDNFVQLSRETAATAAIDGIIVRGFYGNFVVVERNHVIGFTVGIYTSRVSTDTTIPKGVLWTVTGNVTDVANLITGGFTDVNNVT